MALGLRAAFFRRWYQKVLALLLACLIIPAFADCELSVTWEPWPPYQYEHEGQVTGLDVELVKAMGEAADCHIRFIKLPWARALDELKRGILDVAPGGSKTTERETYARFSAPYREEAMVLFVPGDTVATLAVDSINELMAQDFRLGVTRDYFYGKDFEKLQQDPQINRRISSVATTRQNFQKLMVGRIDGLLADRFVGTYLIRQLGLEGKVEAYPLVVHRNNIFLMFSKASVDEAVVERINAALATIRSNGTYQRILDDYAE
ncbi:transporter substrate-binding domain-containing protein [Marinobacteraceae bacterium S3BR75-40.1]